MMSLNFEPESASVSCQRSRLTTIWMRQADQVVVDLHVVVAATVLYWWKAQSNPPAPALRSIGRVLRHQVVATLGVVVVLTG